MQHKQIQNNIMGVSIIMMLLCSVSAFGISSPYWEGSPMTPHAGSTQNVQLTLQNMVGDTDITARVVLINGSEIATITDENKDYFIPLGKSDVPINIKITIPEDAKDGDMYNVKLSVTTLATENEGALGISSSIEKSFDVIIISDKKQSLWQNVADKSSPIVYYLIGGIAIVIIGFFLLRKNKENR